MKSKINLPGYKADLCLNLISSGLNTITHFAENELSNNRIVNPIIPALPMPYCKKTCRWEVCGTALPGYPTPVCRVCTESCTIHDSGPYLMYIR